MEMSTFLAARSLARSPVDFQSRKQVCDRHATHARAPFTVSPDVSRVARVATASELLIPWDSLSF